MVVKSRLDFNELRQVGFMAIGSIIVPLSHHFNWRLK